MILIWPIIVLVAGSQLFGIDQRKLARAANRHQQEEQRLAKEWEKILEASDRASQSEYLKITPRSREYIRDSANEIRSKKASWFYYTNDISKSLTEYWESGIEAEHYLDDASRGREGFRKWLRDQGGHVSLNDPDSKLYITESFLESIREIRSQHERSTVIAELEGLDNALHQDKRNVIGRCQTPHTYPLCQLSFGDYCLIFLPDESLECFYLLCVALKIA